MNGITSYAYNGLGDRLIQNVSGGAYTDDALNLNTGLTQVLDDKTNSYTYGSSTRSGGRMAQMQGSTTEYFLGDALGSVRQLTNNVGEVALTRRCDPYG